MHYDEKQHKKYLIYKSLRIKFYKKHLKNSIPSIQFVIFNPRKVQWNWIAFYQNSFAISPGLLYQMTRRDTNFITHNCPS